MKDKPLSAAIGETYDGDRFTQIVTQDGIKSYAINGVLVDQATWHKEATSAHEREMKRTGGKDQLELEA